MVRGGRFDDRHGGAQPGARAGLRAGHQTTKVDGVYDKDPHKHPDAKRFETLSFQELANQHIAVMDKAALGLHGTAHTHRDLRSTDRW